MKRIFLLALVLIAGCFGLNAQTWSGSSLDGDTYRNGNVGIGINIPSNKLSIYNKGNNTITLGVMGVYPTVSQGTSTNYYKQFQVYEPRYNIPSGATDNGYRIGLAVQGYANSSDFAGTLDRQISAWIRAGSYSTSPTGTIKRSMALVIDNLTSSNVTINESFGIYQTSSIAKNYFNGKIGIGTDSPNSALDVISSDFNALKIKRKIPGGIAINLLNGDETGDWAISVGANKHFSIFKSSSSFGSEFIITESGSVGIGTESPDPLYKLSVKGKIRAEEIKVETGWADFVFNKDYSLRPLSEVNSYIQQNGHLPEIPTAKEVEENGISLGEMNAKLLQKIEELTLYTIEQEKRIESLEKQNENILKLFEEKQK